MYNVSTKLKPGDGGESVYNNYRPTCVDV